MSSWGITSAGFYAPQTQEVIDALVDDLQGVFGAQFALNPQAPDGQFTGIFSASMADLFSALEAAYNAGVPSKAVGVCLDDCLSIVGAERIPATRSVLNGVIITGTPGTPVPANFQVAVASNTTQVFQIAAATTVGGGGTVTASFVATSDGPVACPAGQLTSIVNPVAGLASVTNPTGCVDATTGLGQPVETDAAFRLRASQERNRPGTGTPDGLVAYILQNVPNVSGCVPLWNDTDFTSPNGIPPHSFSLLVTGGVDQAVAEAIWTASGGGITTYGNTSLTIEDSNGDGQVVNFTRIITTQVYVIVTSTINTDPTQGPVYPPDGDTQTKTALASLVFAAGQTVNPLALVAAAASVPGVNTATVTLGTAPGPVGTIPLTFDSFHMAQIQAANVTVSS